MKTQVQWHMPSIPEFRRQISESQASQGYMLSPSLPTHRKKEYHDIFTHHALQSIKMIMSTVATYKNIDSNKKAKYILSVLYTHI